MRKQLLKKTAASVLSLAMIVSSMTFTSLKMSKDVTAAPTTSSKMARSRSAYTVREAAPRSAKGSVPTRDNAAESLGQEGVRCAANQNQNKKRKENQK